MIKEPFWSQTWGWFGSGIKTRRSTLVLDMSVSWIQKQRNKTVWLKVTQWVFTCELNIKPLDLNSSSHVMLSKTQDCSIHFFLFWGHLKLQKCTEIWSFEERLFKTKNYFYFLRNRCLTNTQVCSTFLQNKETLDLFTSQMLELFGLQISLSNLMFQSLGFKSKRSKHETPSLVML